MIIMKFGGSSVADANSMKLVYDIVIQQITRKPIVVLSACKGITDNLIYTANLASKGQIETAKKLTHAILNHHFEIIEIDIIAEHYKENAKKEVSIIVEKLDLYLTGISLLHELTPKMLDYCQAVGEMLSTVVFYNIMLSKNQKALFLHSSEIIITNSDFGKALPIKELLLERAKSNLLPLIDEYDIVITQGFIAKDPKGNITTLGRGGSDYSAALIGYAVEAEEIQIWTDVSGVLSTDPRLLVDAKTIGNMSASEIRELSFLGAKVLHPDTIKPAVEAGIPIKVLNTFDPKNSGTTIFNQEQSSEPAVHSITLKKNCTALRISLKTSAASSNQVLDLLGVFIDNKFNILLTSSSESSFIVLLDNLSDTQIRSIPQLLSDYEWKLSSGDILCLVGQNLTANSTAINQIAEIIPKLSPLFMLFGSNNESVFIMVNHENTESAMTALHGLIVS